MPIGDSPDQIFVIFFSSLSQQTACFVLCRPHRCGSRTYTLQIPFFFSIKSSCLIVAIMPLRCVFRRSSCQFFIIIGSAEALPILCVRYIRWERERDTERERERRKWRHHCRAKIGDEFCTSPCQKCAPWAKSFALFLKNLHLSFSPLEWRWVHTSRCQKRCTFRNSSHSSHCQMAWLTGDRSSKANDRISGCTVLLSRRKNRKNESN